MVTRIELGVLPRRVVYGSSSVGPMGPAFAGFLSV